MTDTPRRRAIINGLLVAFESRDPKLVSVRWHPRFKQRYRCKADALAAKEAWEKRGKILWPDELRAKAHPTNVTPSKIRCRQPQTQVESRV